LTKGKFKGEKYRKDAKFKADLKQTRGPAQINRRRNCQHGKGFTGDEKRQNAAEKGNNDKGRGERRQAWETPLLCIGLPLARKGSKGVGNGKSEDRREGILSRRLLLPKAEHLGEGQHNSLEWGGEETDGRKTEERGDAKNGDEFGNASSVANQRFGREK